MRHFIFASSIAVLLSSSVFGQTAVKPRPAVDILPPDTTILLQVRNAAALKKAWADSPFPGLKDDPEIKSFLDQIKGALAVGLSDARNTLGFDPIELITSVEGEVTFAVGGLGKLVEGLIATSMAGGQPDIKPGDLPILLQFDAGGAGEKFQGYMHKILAIAQEKEGATSKTEDLEGVDGVKITTVTNPQAGANELSRLFIGQYGSSFTLSINRAFLESTLKGLAGAEQPSLRQDPDFAVTNGFIDTGSSDLIAFVNIKNVFEAIRTNAAANPMVGMFWNLAEQKLFGTQLRNFGLTLNLRDDGIHESWMINTNGAKDGLLGALNGPTFDPKTIKGIPANADSAGRVSIDFQHLYGIIKDIANMAMSFMGQPGVDIEQYVELQFQIKLKEVVGSLGHFVTGYSVPTEKPSPFAALLGVGNLALSIDLKSEEPLRNLLNMLVLLSDNEIEKAKDLDLYKLDPSSGDASPAVAVANKKLAFGLSPDSVKSVVNGKGVGTSLAENGIYQTLAAKLPNDVVLMEYYTPQALRNSLKVLETIQADIPIPNLDPVVKVLKGSVGYARWSDKGLTAKFTTLYAK